MEIVEVAKKHPIAIGVGALVVVLLIARSGSGGASASGSDPVAAQENVAIVNANAAASAQRTQVMGALYADSVQANSQVAISNNQTGLAAMLGILGTAATVRQHDEQLQAVQDQLHESTTQAAMQFQAQQTMHNTDANTVLTMYAQKMNLDHFQIEQTAANLPAIASMQESLANIAGANAIQLATVNGQTAQAVASVNTAAARTTANAQSTSSTLGDMAGLASMAMMFL